LTPLPPPPSLPPDILPPSFNITGRVPVTGTIAPDASTATFPAFPAWAASDAVDAAPAVTCKAPLGAGGAPAPVTAGATAFPYGVTVVTCSAADRDGNTSPAASFAVVMNCTAGYPFKDGKCQSEFFYLLLLPRQEGRDSGRGA
jgi:hypothetical protein